MHYLKTPEKREHRRRIEVEEGRATAGNISRSIALPETAANTTPDGDLGGGRAAIPGSNTETEIRHCARLFNVPHPSRRHIALAVRILCDDI